jgi:integrase
VLDEHRTKGIKLAQKRGPKTESVSLPWRAVGALAAIKPENARPDELVFVPKRGERMSVNRDWTRIRIAADLPDGLTLHGLRHSVGTAAVIAGLSLPEIQKLLRHRNPTTAAKYIHLAEHHQSRFQDRATAHLDPEPNVVVQLPKRA